jgi:class 3 adenylate cyclase
MTEHRIVPAATRRQVDGLSPQRVLSSLRALFGASDVGEGVPVPLGPGSNSTDADGTGVEPPVPYEHTGEPIGVTRTFAFVDITGFTEFCDKHGEHAAIDVLTRFRSLVRDITARRGVRVAKWLGDGAMLVGVEEGPILASVAEVVLRTRSVGLDTHAGVASGKVLLFEGDDYVGRPPNLAARLCDVAESGEILAHSLTGPLPSWVETRNSITLEIAGVGELVGVASVGAYEQIADVLADDGAAA